MPVRFTSVLSLLALLAGASAAHAKSSAEIAFRTDEATWMALDVSPDGRTILFDMLGDIYALDIRGGEARPLLTGEAFETQPVFSPDGTRIAFISDRSGAPNLWIADSDGGNARRLSDDTGPALYTSPAWSADGAAVFVSRTVHPILAFELFRYDLPGGGKTQVTKASPSGNERHDDRVNVLGATASPDGRYLYYARKEGTLWSEKPLPHWSVYRRDIARGTEDRIIASPGAAMRPALSRDGTKLVYASRRGARTGLRLRDLTSGEDRWLAWPVDHDSQMSGFYTDLVPRIAFLPGNRAVLTAIDGRITRIDLADGKRTPIPFTAGVKLAVMKNTRVAIEDETGPVRVRVIQSPRLSPDGTRIVFSALGKLYVQDVRDGARPEAVTGTTTMAWQPAWSPDGRSIAYVTWSATEGGALWMMPARGGTPRRLTRDGAFYTEPAISPDGRHVAVLRASQTERLNAPGDLSPNRPTDIVLLPVGGGPARLVASASGARALGFDSTGGRLRVLLPGGLESFSVADGSRRREAEIKVANPNRYFANSVPPEDARLSPDGRRLLVKAASQAYLIDMPQAGEDDAPTIDLTTPAMQAQRLTDIGADAVDWRADGGAVLWSVGSTMRIMPTDEAAASARGTAEQQAATLHAPVDLPRDIPAGTTVLRGGTAITMRGDEIIPNADIVITGDRIVSVGPAGSVPVPDDAIIRDIGGKFVTPGFIDTHAHWFELNRGVLDPQHWNLQANLAFGVTSVLDVQPFTTDIFGYQDMIDAGLATGPRAFSTGPGIFQNSAIDTPDDVRAVLTRYRDHYRTRNIKAYMVGNRTQRRAVTAASAELGVMPTTEGASDLNLGLTHAIDGFAGNEHNLPVSPLRNDVVTLMARSRIGYTPTLTVLYGGSPAFANAVIGDGLTDPRIARFLPPGAIEAKLRDRKWVPPVDSTYASFAADALRIRRAGGLVGIGSHGTVQGLGYHFELAAYADGGASLHEVLRAATIDSAEIIGRAAYLGSIEPGKYADLLILSADPLADIGNARRIDRVVKNGRAYDPATLDEVWPNERKQPPLWFHADTPAAR